MGGEGECCGLQGRRSVSRNSDIVTSEWHRGPALLPPRPLTSLERPGLFPFLGERLPLARLSHTGQETCLPQESWPFVLPSPENPGGYRLSHQPGDRARRQPFPPPSLSRASHWLTQRSSTWQASLGDAVLGGRGMGGRAEIGADRKNQPNISGKCCAQHTRGAPQPRGLKQEWGGDRNVPEKDNTGAKAGREGRRAVPCGSLTCLLCLQSP